VAEASVSEELINSDSLTIRKFSVELALYGN